jgi:carboxyl-terminal processing protease
MKKSFLCLVGCCLLTNLSFSQVQMSPGTQKMGMAMYALKNLYVDSINENKLVEAGLRAMIKELDPHSAYMTQDETKEMNEPLQGGFDGIGISFNMFNDTLFIVEVISGGPSEKVGLLPGDRILKVDGVNIAGVKTSNRDVMKRLKGPKGTLVTVSVKRRNITEILDFKIIRGKIPIYSLDASFMVDKKTGYIRLNRFGATTADEFRQAFSELKKKGMTQLILDLESNGGGLMNAAIELADDFLSKDKCIVYTEGLHSPRQDNLATAKGIFENGKLIVLIDEYSASSSEILAGAIQDWDRGIIMGRRSFGKGLVQRPIPLLDGSMLKLTIARYYTPSGRFIQKPYEDTKNYDQDLIDRYNHGEMVSKDSIHFPDSLRTYTLENKRVIYGGGGIMPDVFIPMDTVRYTSLHRSLSNSGIMNRFSMNYVDEHRAELTANYPDIDAFVANFQPDTVLTESLMRFALSEKSKLTAEDSSSDKTLMLKQLKAFMARDMGKSTDYFKVMWTENESLLKAMAIINDKKAYDEILKRK